MQILQTRFGEEDIQKLRERGLAHDCDLRGTSFDGAWNATYKGMVDIRAMFPQDEVPTWMEVRVDTKDGVPWLVSIVFKIPEALQEAEEKVRELARQFGIGAHNLLINAYRARLGWQTFGSFGHVLQINSTNEDPEKLLPFLEATERMLQVA